MEYSQPKMLHYTYVRYNITPSTHTVSNYEVAVVKYSEYHPLYG